MKYMLKTIQDPPPNKRATLFFTELQNCRGWKGPPEFIESNPSAKADSLEQVAQVDVQTGFEYLHRRRLHNLSEQPAPVLCHPYYIEILPHVYMELPVFKF